MRVKLKFQKRFSLNRFFMILAMFCVTSYALLEHVSISVPLFSFVKMPLMYVGGVCLLSQANMLVKTFMKKKYFYVWLAVLALCVSLVISMVANRNPRIGTFPLRNTIRMVLFLVELVSLMIWLAEEGMGRFFLRFLFHYTLILVILTDALLLTGLVRFDDGRFETYLVGTKFIVSYMHMDLLALWIARRVGDTSYKKIPKMVLIFVTLLLVLISLRVECITGLLGCIILFVCLMVVDLRNVRWLKILTSPVMLMAALLLNLIFPLIARAIVAIPVVEYLIVEVFHRSLTLTGRTNIFNLFGSQMEGHWLFGYGAGNANAAAVALFGYANAQNSILQWILQSGIVSTVILAVWMMLVFFRIHDSNRLRRCLPMIMLVYVYILLGMVEITFSMSFLLWVSVLFLQAGESEKRLPS